ncbi:transposase [Achromobacter denitrificans]
MKYSPERREAILAKLEAPYNRTVNDLAAEEGISTATIYNWRKQAPGVRQLKSQALDFIDPYLKKCRLSRTLC